MTETAHQHVIRTDHRDYAMPLSDIHLGGTPPTTEAPNFGYPGTCKTCGQAVTF